MRYALLIAFVSSLVMGVVAVQYANHVDRQSNQQWCEIVVTLDETYDKQPPQSESGKVIAREMKRMRHDFDCKE
jgi:hypothetical protein